MSTPGKLPDVVVRFRAMSGCWARGIAVVSSIDSAGALHGLTLRAMTPVSFSPLRLLICIGEKSRTYAALQQSGVFCVNILSADQQPLADHFGSSKSDKFAGQAYDLLPSGLPALHGTLGSIECRVSEIIGNSYHHVVFGDVINQDVRLGDPLLSYGPAYTRITAAADTNLMGG